MKRNKIILVIILALTGLQLTIAQNNLILKGRVVDANDKLPVIGATIVEYDNENRVINGVITNVDGDFLITLKNASNTVKVSMIGYQEQEIQRSTNTVLFVELKPSTTELEAVTVTAESKSRNLLTNVEDRDNASASVKVDLEELKSIGVSSAAEALQGKVSGLDIISASGDPGSGSQIVIRGLSSMGNNKPLIVIDGIPQFKVGSDFELSSASAEDISNLINVAVQDIRSIEVLKDAASTAIYGSRGADGVLIIETKRGRMGKVQFDYQYKQSLKIEPAAIPLLSGDEYIMLQLEEWHNSIGIFGIPNEISYNRNNPQFYNYSANTDWLGAITQNGKTNDHYFSISGGGRKTSFFTSISYVDEEGTSINTNSKRFSTRTKLNYNLSKKLLFQINFSYSLNNQKLNYSFWDGEKQVSVNIRQMAYVKAPNMSIYEYDENGVLTGEYFNPIISYQPNDVYHGHPVAIAEQGRKNNVSNNLENSYMLQYRIIPWMIMRQTVTFQFLGRKENQFLPYTAVPEPWTSSSNNVASEQNNLASSIRSETQMQFSNPFKTELHELTGAVSWIVNQTNKEGVFIRGVQNPSVNVDDPAIGSHVGWLNNGDQEERLLSGVANLNYKYKDKYLIQGNLRADGHSSFGEENRWGLFKGVSVGWRFSEEPFMKYLKFLGDSKLRFSWGVSGRQPNNVYARFAKYEPTGNGNYINNPSIAPQSVQLSNLRWEKITSYNVGMDMNLFKNRLFLEGDVYQKVTSDILFPNYGIPNLSGYDVLTYFNGGELTNYGWELMVDGRVFSSQNWLFAINFNISQNTNVFSKLPENFNPEKSTNIENGQYPLRIEEGAPIGSFFGFRYLGVFPSDADAVARDAQGNVMYDSEGSPLPLRYLDVYTFKGGDAIYEDLNHDGVIDLNDVARIGNSNPKYIGGFGSRIRYKNLYFSFGFNYRLGFDIVNGVALETQAMNSRDNQSKAVLRRWRTQGQDEENMLPKASMNHPANNLGSDRYVEKGDYLRLNNIRLSYDLNKNLTERLGLRKVNIGISARKLLTFTSYSGQDPEIGQDASDPFWMGVDEARTPPSKMYTINISIGF